MKNFRALSFLFSVLTLMTVAEAAKSEKTTTHALARYGNVKYATDNTPAYANPKAPKGGELRLGALGTFDNMNLYSYIGTRAQGLSLTLAPLMKRSSDEAFSVYGVLAQKVELSPDNSFLKVYLQANAKFHDGKPVTSADVEFTFEVLREKGRPAQRRFYSRIKEIKIHDKKTLTIYFKKLEDSDKYDPEIPLIIAMARILPKHALEGKDYANTGMLQILGNGPYKIEKVVPGRSITYVRDPNFWGKDIPFLQGSFNFDKVTFNYYKNKQALTQALISGEVDYYPEADLKTWKTAFNVAAIKDGRVKKVEISHKLPVPVRTMIFNMRQKIFQDKRVRQALVLAFDFETLNKLLYHGEYKRMTSLFANSGLGHEGPASELEKETLKPFMDKIAPEILEASYNIPATLGGGNLGPNRRTAEKLLQQAGWILKDGKRVHKDTGKPLTFKFMIKDQYLEKVANLYKESLRKNFGIEIVVKKMATVQYENSVVNSEFGMIIHTWSNSRSPGNEQAYYFSPKAADTPGSSNYIGVKNPMLEKLAAQIPLADTREGLIARVRALDRVVMNEYLFIPLAYDNKSRFLYWADRVVLPKFDPNSGVNVTEHGWSKMAEIKANS